MKSCNCFRDSQVRQSRELECLEPSALEAWQPGWSGRTRPSPDLIQIHREIRHLDSARPDLPATNSNEYLDRNRIVDMRTFRTTSCDSSSVKSINIWFATRVVISWDKAANVDCPSWKTGSEPRSISACRSRVGLRILFDSDFSRKQVQYFAQIPFRPPDKPSFAVSTNVLRQVASVQVGDRPVFALSLLMRAAQNGAVTRVAKMNSAGPKCSMLCGDPHLGPNFSRRFVGPFCLLFLHCRQ